MGMGRRNPTKISAAYLERVTAWYLERWSTTSTHLRKLLMTRVERSVAHHGSDRDEALRLVDAELRRLQEANLLDDTRYAADKLRSLRRRGSSAAKIRATLSAKGISAERIDSTLAEEQEATDALMRRIAELLSELRGEAPPESLWDPADHGQSSWRS